MTDPELSGSGRESDLRRAQKLIPVTETHSIRSLQWNGLPSILNVVRGAATLKRVKLENGPQ